MTQDLVDNRHSEGQLFFFKADEMNPTDLKSDRPRVHFTHNGGRVIVECDYIAGCDGFHGVSRQSIPGDVIRTFELVYPFD